VTDVIFNFFGPVSLQSWSQNIFVDYFAEIRRLLENVAPSSLSPIDEDRLSLLRRAFETLSSLETNKVNVAQDDDDDVKSENSQRALLLSFREGEDEAEIFRQNIESLAYWICDKSFIKFDLLSQALEECTSWYKFKFWCCF
jgi:hypothetical protein